MAAVNYTVRFDETDKKEAESVFNDLGLTLAAGLNVYIKMVARKRRIPFDLALDSSPDISHPIASIKQRRKSADALRGLLAGHEVDLDQMREERIMSKYDNRS